ncbi:hypothetical protein Nmel_004576 [Mimus melanotis]
MQTTQLPACNVLLLGAQPSPSPLSCPTLASSTTATSSSPCTVEGRVDSFHESQDGKVECELEEEIEHKFNKQQDPAPVKALLVPLDGQRERRGGWQYQKMKECFGADRHPQIGQQDELWGD